MFILIYFKDMGRCLARSSESHSISFYFLIICTILIGFPIQYLKIF